MIQNTNQQVRLHVGMDSCSLSWLDDLSTDDCVSLTDDCLLK